MISNVLKGFGSIISIRILSRITEFILRIYIIRNVLDEETLSHIIHLDLVYNASLHIVKDCLKKSYQKLQNKEEGVKSSMNLMTIGIVATVISASIVSVVQMYQFQSTGKVLAYFIPSIYIYAISAILQSVAQKYLVHFVLDYQYYKISLLQMGCTIPKTIFMFITAHMGWFHTYGIMIFAVGKVIYSLFLMGISFAQSPNKSLLIASYPVLKPEQNIEKGSIVPSYRYIDPKTMESLKDLSSLSFLKLLLNQFQKIFLVILDIARVSSVYSLISNLGSLIVRYVYAPLEEVLYNYFSRGDEKESLNTLTSFIRGLLTFSAISLCYGYNYSESFVMLIYGQKWVNEESIAAMRAYSVLLSVMGMNGILEAFTFARGKESVARYKYFSIVTTVLHVAATFMFVRMDLGTAGLFFGNAVSMVGRICVCWFLQISHHISLGQFVKLVIPNRIFLILCCLSFFVCHKQYGVTHQVFQRNSLTFLLGMLLIMVNLLPVIYSNREKIIKTIKEKLQKRKNKQQ